MNINSVEFKSYSFVGESKIAKDHYIYMFEVFRNDTNKSISIELLFNTNKLNIDITDKSNKIALLKTINNEINRLDEVNKSIRALDKINNILSKNGKNSESKIDEYIRIRDNTMRYKEFFSEK